MSTNASFDDTAPSALRRRPRLAVTLGAAFAVLCAVILGLDTPLSLAQGGFIQDFFGGGGAQRVYELRYDAAPRMRPYRHGAHRHGSHRFSRASIVRKAHFAELHRRRVAHAAAARRAIWRLAHGPITPRRHEERYARHETRTPDTGEGRRLVCVRSCDGYFFPAQSGGEAGCAKACPGSVTRLYVLPAGSDQISDAVAAHGGGAFSVAAKEDGKSCSCNAASGDRAAWLDDSTLRPGDTVVTSTGVRVLRSGSRFPYKSSDFLSLADTRNVSLDKRGALAAIEKAIRTPRGRLAVVGDHHREKRLRRERRSDISIDAGAQN